MRPEVLVLQHAAPETPGAIGEAIRANGLRARVVRGFAGETVPLAPRGARGLVILGGPMGARDTGAHPFLKRELRLIERTLGAGLPVLGVCLGSQLLATALGATVRAASRSEIGWFDVDVHAEDDPLFAGVRAITPLHWHSDIFTLPRGAVPLARSRKTAVQAYRHDARTYGLLFHMEVSVPMVRRAARVFRRDLEDEGIDPAKLVSDAQRHVARTNDIARRVFGRWAALCK